MACLRSYRTSTLEARMAEKKKKIRQEREIAVVKGHSLPCQSSGRKPEDRVVMVIDGANLAAPTIIWCGSRTRLGQNPGRRTISTVVIAHQCAITLG